MTGDTASDGKRLIAFVAYPGMTPLDIVGPLTVLRDLRVGTNYRTVVVGERADAMPTGTPLGVVPARTFAEVASPYAVFVPGGGAATVEALQDEALVSYVRTAAASAEIVGAIGNGALVLGAAGLLDGRRATTHWAYADLLQAHGATYVREPWVEDGRLLTAAGGTAGVDAMLYLTAKLRNTSAARLAQLWMEYDPQPPFGRPQAVTPDTELGGLVRARPARVPRPGRTTIAVVLYPDLTALDLVGPLQVLAELERFAPEFENAVVAERAGPVETDIGMALLPDRTFGDLARPDVLIVPGGRRGTIRALSDPAIRSYVASAARSGNVVASVCTGSLILGSVGLLDGRRATTNWAFEGVLERLGGRYVRERWIHDGKLVMSAGVSAGIDMALYLASILTDEATARRLQQAVDYDPQPPFGGIDWDRLPFLARAARAAISVAAPMIAAKPRWMTRAERRSGFAAERAT
jgi:transcriptional regulator GlxA family with amidase domain